MSATTKVCTGCNALLRASDPDVCELCDLHAHDETDIKAMAWLERIWAYQVEPFNLPLADAIERANADEEDPR